MAHQQNKNVTKSIYNKKNSILPELTQWDTGACLVEHIPDSHAGIEERHTENRR